jgi:transcriptional regulator with XRE-family HTH domain
MGPPSTGAKIEKGVNRIGASRLFQISKILDVPVQFFFEEAPHVGDRHHARGMAEPESETFILEFLNSREGSSSVALAKIASNLKRNRSNWALSASDLVCVAPLVAGGRSKRCRRPLASDWRPGQAYPRGLIMSQRNYVLP